MRRSYLPDKTAKICKYCTNEKLNFNSIESISSTSERICGVCQTFLNVEKLILFTLVCHPLRKIIIDKDITGLNEILCKHFRYASLYFQLENHGERNFLKVSTYRRL